MKNLFVHMEDESTDFLAEIYRGEPGKVVRGDISSTEMNDLIADHDRVVMMGHGSPSGLFGINGSACIGTRNAEALKDKDNVYIWCHASAFVRNYNLKGFSTGMFISEVGEATFCGIEDSPYIKDMVTQSNYAFASLVREYIDRPAVEIYQYVTTYYNELQVNGQQIDSSTNQILSGYTEGIWHNQIQPCQILRHNNRIEGMLHNPVVEYNRDRLVIL